MTKIHQGAETVGKIYCQAYRTRSTQYFRCCDADLFLNELSPGGPFVAEKSISKAAQKALEAKYGLDKPLFERYITYITDFVQGDMGLSLRQRGKTVSDIIFSKFPVSAGLAVSPLLSPFWFGIPLGCLSAYNRGKFADNFIIVLMTCGIAIPSFITSVILLYTFGSQLKLLPTIVFEPPPPTLCR